MWNDGGWSPVDGGASVGGATATGRGHVTVQRIVPIAAERAFRQSCRRDGRERELPDNPVDEGRILGGYGPYRGHNPHEMSEAQVPGGVNSLDATRPRTLERPSISHGMEHKNASPPPPADRPSPTVFSLAASPQVFVAP